MAFCLSKYDPIRMTNDMFPQGIIVALITAFRLVSFPDPTPEGEGLVTFSAFLGLY